MIFSALHKKNKMPLKTDLLTTFFNASFFRALYPLRFDVTA